MNLWKHAKKKQKNKCLKGFLKIVHSSLCDYDVTCISVCHSFVRFCHFFYFIFIIIKSCPYSLDALFWSCLTRYHSLLLCCLVLLPCNTPAAPLCLRAIGCFLPWTGTQGEMAYKSSEWSLTERLRLQDGWSFKQVGEWKSVMLWTDVAEHRAGMSCHKKKSYTCRSAPHGVKLYFL